MWILLLAAMLFGARGAAGQLAGTADSASVQGAPLPGADAQQAVADTAPRFVSGRVMRPTGSDVVPVPGVWVTLHRVGPDSSGPLDSTRTRGNGEYAFRYSARGSAQAIYFLAVSYRGVAYFSAPLRDRRVTGDDALITVFDTTSAPIPLHVQGRHIVVSNPNSAGFREIVEVYEISNDTTLTRVSPDDAHPTWSTILPAAAENFQVAQADISPSSISAASGRVTSVAPFAPGLKQLSFAYDLPESAFPLDIPLADSVPVLEVLLEEPGAKVTGARLAQVAPASIEGRTFNRFLAQNAPKNGVFTITAPPPGTPPLSERFQLALIAVLSLAMLAALAMYFSRRHAVVGAAAPASPAAVPAWSPPVSAEGAEAARIAREIAALDEAHERNGTGGVEADERYRARRAELKRALAAELDARRGRE
ncbi:MAG TPA: hypothetical protein VFR95_03730 [Gemmatimonadaceae bacterium]|nr:hypothetical protein [Gemmatimonadaceae bacterium]